MKVSEVLKGVKHHVIYEVLISSISIDGEPDIAPMGLRFSEKFEEFTLHPLSPRRPIET